MDVSVTSDVMEAMRGAAKRAHPAEACGILMGEEGRISTLLETENVHSRPQTHFEIDPAALIGAHKKARAGGPQVLGYFHSHPTGDAAPSATDQAQSAGDGAIWAIAGDTQINFWRDDARGFARLDITVI